MNVEISGARRADINESELAGFAASILERESVDDASTLSITFIDTEAIAVLNAAHMSKDGPTDVLSFPIEDARPGHPPQRSVDGPPLDLGDIFLCEDVVDLHANEHAVRFDAEVHLMVVHGVLHILGWDHQTEGEALAMEAREAEHMATIGLIRR